MELRGTTIIGVKKDGRTIIAGDGQATLGEHVIMKSNSKKVFHLRKSPLKNFLGIF